MATARTTSILDRTVLKEGQTFLVADLAGNVRTPNVDGHGLYFQDMRHLSRFELDVDSTRLSLLSAAGELNFMSNLQLTNDEAVVDDAGNIAPPRSISIRRNRFILDGLHERLGFFNYNRHAVLLRVTIKLGADFRDMFDVRGYAIFSADVRGEVTPPLIDDEGILLGYRGRDGAERRTRITFDPHPSAIEILQSEAVSLADPLLLPGISGHGDARLEVPVLPPTAAAIFELSLPPHEWRSITFQVRPEADLVPVPQAPHESLDEAFLRIRSSYESWADQSTRIETDHEIFDQLLRRSSQDLRLLTDDFAGQLVPAAGIPWFAVPFGRDSLITALQTLSLRPELARGTLRYLAERQGDSIDDFRDEQPGKILHEVRLGELSRLGAVPHTAYFGSVDSTPLFLITLGEYVRWSGDLELVRELLPCVERALTWIDLHGDADGDGFVEFESRSANGIRNQGWKDSFDSTSHVDGSMAPLPIALAEVQAYVYAARHAAADLYEALRDQPDKALRLRVAAEELRTRFLTHFAAEDDEGALWAMALDGKKQRVETMSTNPAHALWTGLLRGEDAATLVRRLMSPDMLCGWGLRTLSSDAATFNPMSYHNGSVWPHDNAIIALGLKRQGFDAEALTIATQVFEAGFRFPSYRLPELYCGFARDRRYHSIPAQYPVACSPQAWAAGSAFMLLQAILGLEADALNGSLRLRPTLPEWISRVTLRKLRVNGRSVDLDVFREGHRVRVEVLDDGGLQIAVRT